MFLIILKVIHVCISTHSQAYPKIISKCCFASNSHVETCDGADLLNHLSVQLSLKSDNKDFLKHIPLKAAPFHTDIVFLHIIELLVQMIT